MAHEAKVFTDANFDNEVLQGPGTVLVDFWAPWCGPCRAVGPVIEELAQELSGKVKVGKVNIDENTETARKFRISSIPTVLVFKDGEVVQTIVGAQPKSNYEQALSVVQAA